MQGLKGLIAFRINMILFLHQDVAEAFLNGKVF